MVQKTYFKTKGYCKVKFSFKAENADAITIHGLNNDWDTSVSMSKKKDGSFACEVSLPKDTKHEFKYRVNETLWLTDTEADTLNLNEFGDYNSVIIL